MMMNCDESMETMRPWGSLAGLADTATLVRIVWIQVWDNRIYEGPAAVA